MSGFNDNQKPYGLVVDYTDFYKDLGAGKPTKLECFFDPYYKQNSSVISPLGEYSFRNGYSDVKNKNTIVQPLGFESLSFGTANIRNQGERVHPTSIVSNLRTGTPLVVNWNKSVSISGINSQAFSYATFIENKTKYPNPIGVDSAAYGRAYLQGGVKYLAAKGYEATLFGKTDALNTTVTQYAKLSGIYTAQQVPAPSVSPRMLYASGIYQTKLGMPDVRDPAVKPLGSIHSDYGNATVWFHTRYLSPANVSAYQSGYATVFDPTQTVGVQSLITSAIFGDTATKNLSSKIVASSIDDSVVTPWAVVENTNRYYSIVGIDSQSFGSLLIRNGTPQLFAESIEPFDVGSSAIGFKIRSVTPSGFDRLLLGKPLLNKTPELKPSGINAPALGATTISNKTRYLTLVGVDSFIAGKPTTWFRYRYLASKAWQSSKFSAPALTHGLRVIEPLGFVRDVYGNSWVSRGVRYVEPVAIYRQSQSNHLVGGTQTLAPYGYAATLFGTRITPESTNVYAESFTGVFGLSRASLYIQKIQAQGYITVGQQPADRWGDSVLYNQVQYIKQEFDASSDLTPPKWSDWTLIENRNKAIGAVGFSPLRFGYSQIDNNASLLSAQGISPPTSDRFNVSMIAYAIRTVVLDGVEPPLMSDWGVVYNGARVMQPTAIIGLSTGQPIVKNTRRYYQNIGRFESLEFGTPAIGYRIRTIDIEKRYSIEPPQINLPNVDLYTRYIDHVGYEPDAYGLPNLSIHFNIIAPKWNYRDKQGYPNLKNVTPELGVYGHNSEAFGVTAIRTQYREVIAQGDTATLIGLHRISDIRQVIALSGWRDTVVSQKPIVIKTGTNPYTLQNVFLNNESDPTKNGYGIYQSVVDKPSLNQNVLYPNGIKSDQFGSIVMWSNNLQVDVGMAIPNFGYGTSVINKVRAIDFNDNNDYKPIPSQIAVGKPVLSPMTIWAVMDAPKQARDNHPLGGSQRLHYVGHPPNGSPKLPFGVAKIESTIRAINLDKQGVGAYMMLPPVVELSIRTITPESFRRYAFGVPAIPYTGKDIVTKSDDAMSLYGEAVLSREDRGPRTVATKGRDALVFGDSSIDNYQRWLLTYGKDSLVMGGSVKGDTPFMWQGLRVGEHIPLIIGGGDTSIFGDHSISLRIREIPIVGFDAFLCEYDVDRFNDRLRVISIQKPNNLTQEIVAQGFKLSSMGYTDVRLGQYYIRPDGNSDQFRKGGYHA